MSSGGTCSTTSTPGRSSWRSPSLRLIEAGELIAYRYDGFWEPMDTIKDKQRLDALAESGTAPWRSDDNRSIVKVASENPSRDPGRPLRGRHGVYVVQSGPGRHTERRGPELAEIAGKK